MAKELTKEQQAVKDSIAKMSTMEKVSYYVNTYKFHALAIIVVVAFVVSVLRSVLTNPSMEFYVGVINGKSFNSDYVNETLPAALVLGTRQEICIYEDLSTDANGYGGGYYNLIDMYIMADEMNVAFCDEAGLAYLNNLGNVVEAESWMTDDLYKLWSDRVLDCEVTEDTTADLEVIKGVYPVAVDISGTKVMETLGLDEKTHYMIGVCTYEHEYYMKLFSKYLYNIEMGE